MAKLRRLGLLVVLLIPMAARGQPASENPTETKTETETETKTETETETETETKTETETQIDPDIELDCDDASPCHARPFPDASTGPREDTEAVHLVNLVAFKPGRVRVYSRDRERLSALAAAWRRNPQWGQITIEGFDRVPGPLAQRRADKIRGYLIRYGVAAEYVVAIGRAAAPAASGPGLGRTDATIAICNRSSQACQAPVDRAAISSVSALE